jgi:hypothetical protein
VTSPPGSSKPTTRTGRCDYDLTHNPEPRPRRGVWEDFEGQSLEGVNRQKFVSPEMTFEDFQGWLLTKISQGWPEGLLLKIAGVGLQRFMEATDRWEKLEYGRDKTAPLWLDRREAGKLAAMLRGLKGAEARSIRQLIEQLFE